MLAVQSSRSMLGSSVQTLYNYTENLLSTRTKTGAIPGEQSSKEGLPGTEGVLRKKTTPMRKEERPCRITKNRQRKDLPVPITGSRGTPTRYSLIRFQDQLTDDHQTKTRSPPCHSRPSAERPVELDVLHDLHQSARTLSTALSALHGRSVRLSARQTVRAVLTVQTFV